MLPWVMGVGFEILRIFVEIKRLQDYSITLRMGI